MIFGHWYLVLDSKLVTYQKNITKNQKNFFYIFLFIDTLYYLTTENNRNNARYKNSFHREKRNENDESRVRFPRTATDSPRQSQPSI